MCGFCNVWVCVCVGFVMCGYVYVWVCVCMGTVMCGCVYVWGFVMCWCFGNMCTCIYCVLVLFHLCIFILICFVCTSVRTTATE